MIELDVEKRRSAGDGGKSTDYSPVVRIHVASLDHSCNTCTHTHIRTHALTTHTCTHTHIHAHTRTHTRTHIRTHMHTHTQTRNLVKGVTERAVLLLNVTISQDAFSRSASTEDHRNSRDDFLSTPTSDYARSLSAPPLTAEFGLRSVFVASSFNLEWNLLLG